MGNLKMFPVSYLSLSLQILTHFSKQLIELKLHANQLCILTAFNPQQPCEVSAVLISAFQQRKLRHQDNNNLRSVTTCCKRNTTTTHESSVWGTCTGLLSQMAFLSSLMMVRQKISPVCDYSLLRVQFISLCSDDWFVHSFIELF